MVVIVLPTSGLLLSGVRAYFLPADWGSGMTAFCTADPLVR